MHPGGAKRERESCAYTRSAVRQRCPFWTSVRSQVGHVMAREALRLVQSHGNDFGDDPVLNGSSLTWP